jgi:hypothetical protein
LAREDSSSSSDRAAFALRASAPKGAFAMCSGDQDAALLREGEGCRLSLVAETGYARSSSHADLAIVGLAGLGILRKTTRAVSCNQDCVRNRRRYAYVMRREVSQVRIRVSVREAPFRVMAMAPMSTSRSRCLTDHAVAHVLPRLHPHHWSLFRLSPPRVGVWLRCARQR